MNTYEALFIIRPDLKDEDTKTLLKVINETVTKHGSAIQKEEAWGKKYLAYPVKKFKEGYYYKLEFQGPADSIAKIEPVFKLNDAILRTLITRK